MARSGEKEVRTLPFESDQPIREFGIRDLKDRASEVIRSVASGERVVVTKRGNPVAVVVSIEDALDLLLANSDEFVRMRLEARRDLEWLG